MNPIPWYVFVCFSIPFVLGGFLVGAFVANVRGAPRLLVAAAGAVGGVVGQWLVLLELPRLTHSPWPTALAGALVGAIALSLLAATLSRPR